MIIKTGKNLEWVRTMSLVQPNLTWYATYTQDITSIRFTNPAHATLN